jgi:beta-lactamase regulating signal transducer with metallopeptidase domain
MNTAHAQFILALTVAALGAIIWLTTNIIALASRAKAALDSLDRHERDLRDHEARIRDLEIKASYEHEQLRSGIADAKSVAERALEIAGKI